MKSEIWPHFIPLYCSVSVWEDLEVFMTSGLIRITSNFINNQKQHVNTRLYNVVMWSVVSFIGWSFKTCCFTVTRTTHYPPPQKMYLIMIRRYMLTTKKSLPTYPHNVKSLCRVTANLLFFMNGLIVELWHLYYHKKTSIIIQAKKNFDDWKWNHARIIMFKTSFHSMISAL